MSGPDGIACDRPCLFGIRPGETSFQQATKILRTHPLTRDAKWLDGYTLQLPGPDAFIAFSLTIDGVVDGIVLTDNLTDTGVAIDGSVADSVSLGELIMAYGLGDVVLPDSHYFFVEFPDANIAAASARSSNWATYVQPNTPVSMLMVYTLRSCTKPTYKLYVQRWQGFTTLQQYFNDARSHSVSHRSSGVPIPPYVICQNPAATSGGS
jgi:hypothetical protein